MNTWVIIPALNVAPVLADTLSDICAQAFTIVVIDDGSHDATIEVAAKAGVHVLRHGINRGQGAALQTGVSYALRKGADIIVHFDGDGQHRAEDIGRLVEPIEQSGVDVVLGSRFLRSEDRARIPLERRLFLRMAILFTRVFSGIRLTDTHNGLRAFSRAAAERITITEDRYTHPSQIIHEIARNGLSYVEVPVSIEYTEYSRMQGHSSLRRTAEVIRRLFWKNLFLS